MSNPLYQHSFVRDPKYNDEYAHEEADQVNRKLADHVESKKRDHYDPPRNLDVLDKNILKTNSVVEPNGNLKDLRKGKLIKEARIVLSIDSAQRDFFSVSDLTDPEEYINYITPQAYNEFSELYELAQTLTRQILTYEQYAANNNIIIDVIGNGEESCRNIVENLSRGYVCKNGSRARSLAGIENISDINSSLIDLLTNVAVNISGRADYESMANVLNAFAMSGAAFSPSNFWRPFYFTGDTTGEEAKIKQIRYKEQHPNKYLVTLPRIANHVKSLRLISSEIPNTINNVTDRNNIITLQLRETKEGINNGNPYDVPLDPKISVFNFIMVKLDTGCYNIPDLLAHMQNKINEEVKTKTLKKFGDMFKITYNSSSGAIHIRCDKRPEITFHLKFYSELVGVVDVINPGDPELSIGKSHGVVNNFSHDLWYQLGFPWPYEITSTGDNHFSQCLTNVVNFGFHEVFTQGHTNTDIFDRLKTASEFQDIYDNNSNLAGGKFDIINAYRPYRFPNMQHRYIYLVIKGFKSINHFNQSNNVTTFKDRDFFAKIQLNVEPGKIAYNSFVDNPYILLYALDKIEKLEIEWVDDRGEMVDFGKVDHSFTIELIHYVSQLEVNDYDNGLGFIDTESYPLYLRGT
jgi:hypothetical protein